MQSTLVAPPSQSSINSRSVLCVTGNWNSGHMARHSQTLTDAPANTSTGCPIGKRIEKIEHVNAGRLKKYLHASPAAPQIS